MPDSKITFYEKLVYAVYGYYIVVGAAWFILSMAFGGIFNYWSFFVMATFAIQAYYRHKLTNLILGVVALGVSIYWLLEFVSLGHQAGYNMFVKVMVGVFLVSILSAGILIFSYTKLSFKDL